MPRVSKDKKSKNDSARVISNTKWKLDKSSIKRTNVTKDHRYKCDQCDLAYTLLGNLTRHKKKAHPLHLKNTNDHKKVVNPLKATIKLSNSSSLNSKKNLTKQRKCTYFIDVETNIGRDKINDGIPAEAVSIGIARLDEDDKDEQVYYKEFKPRRMVDMEAFRTHRLSNM